MSWAVVLIVLASILVVSALIKYKVKNVEEGEGHKSKENELWWKCMHFIDAYREREDAIEELENLKNAYRNPDGSIDYKYLSEDYRVEQKKEMKKAEKKLYSSADYILKELPNNMWVKIDDVKVFKSQEYSTIAEVYVSYDIFGNGREVDNYAVKFDDLVSEGGKINQWMY